jgi:hypothetical protein
MVRALVFLTLACAAWYAVTRTLARPERPFRKRSTGAAASIRKDGPPASNDAAHGVEKAVRPAEAKTLPQTEQALDELRSEMKRESV